MDEEACDRPRKRASIAFQPLYIPTPIPVAILGDWLVNHDLLQEIPCAQSPQTVRRGKNTTRTQCALPLPQEGPSHAQKGPGPLCLPPVVAGQILHFDRILPRAVAVSAGTVAAHAKRKRAVEDRPHWNPLIPETPFFVVCVGPPQSGKTTILLDLLRKRNGYHKKFNRIYVFNPAAKLDPAYRALKIKPERIITSWDSTLMSDMVERKIRWVEKHLDYLERQAKKRKRKRRRRKQKEEEEEWETHMAREIEARSQEESDSDESEEEEPGEDEDDWRLPPPTDLYIVDDTYGTDMTNPHRAGALDKLAVFGHKAKINVWFIGHKWKGQVTPCMRDNATHLIFFALNNASEFEAVRQEVCPPWMTAREFAEMFTACTKETYDFLVAFMRRPRQARFSRTFAHLYIVPTVKSQCAGSRARTTSRRSLLAV